VLLTASLFPELYKIVADEDVYVEAYIKVIGSTLVFPITAIFTF